MQHHWTLRQYRIALEWLKQQWEQPTRDNYYMMQMTYHLMQTPRRVWGQKDSDKFKLGDLALRFFQDSSLGKGQRKLTIEEASAIAKANFLARFGKPLTETPQSP